MPLTPNGPVTLTLMLRALTFTSFLVLACAFSAAAQSGTVSGTVRRAEGQTAVNGAAVYLCTTSQICTSALTNAGGNYTIVAPPGAYYAFTQNVEGLVDEIYDDIPCRGYCNAATAIASGTSIVVTAGNAATGVDFALAVGGSISGTIVNAATSAPVANVFVYVYSILPNGTAYLSGSAFTNAAGVYTASGLPSGAYYLYTFNTAGLTNEIWDNVKCPDQCLNSALAAFGTPVAVTAGATTGGRNFALDLGGAISGRVRDSVTSSGLANVLISIVARGPAATTATVAYAVSDGAGLFIARGLPTGSYYAFTSNSLGYVDEMFDGVPCIGKCVDVSRATPIAVTAGATTTDRNFDLHRGATIAGAIASAAGGPLSGVQVFAYAITADGDPAFAGAATTNGVGNYAIGALAEGVYYLYTSNRSGFVDEIFDNRHCLGVCSLQTALETGTPVAVTQGGTTGGKSFVLDPGGRLAGVVRSANASPIANAIVYAHTVDGQGALVLAGSAPTNAAGQYAVTALPTGTYFAFTDAVAHQDEIYSDVRCLGDCAPATAVTAGQPLAVALGATTGDIDFALDPGGGIAGMVRNAANNAALPGVFVYAYRNVGNGSAQFAGYAVTSGSGCRIGGLPDGEYFVFTFNDGLFDNRAYPSVTCPGSCALDVVKTLGTPVAVASGATTPSIDLDLGTVTGRIAGVITRFGSTQPAPDVFVYLYAGMGAGYTFVGFGRTDANGRYEINRLPPGTYYAVTNSYGEYLDEIHGGTPCLTACDYGIAAVTSGAPIAVTTGTAEVNFQLRPSSSQTPGQVHDLQARIASGTIVFRWSAPYDPPTALDYVLEVGFGPGATAVSIPVAATTYSASSVPPGRYFARVRARNLVGLGPASSEYEFVVNADGSGTPDPPTNLLVFADGGRLHFSWSGARTGGVATDYVLDVGTQTGASDLATLNVGARSVFTYQPLPPPGVYFIRARARNALSSSKPSAEVMLVVGANTAAPPDAPSEIGVSVNASRQVLIGWSPPRGPVTSYRLEVGSAFQRSDIGIFTVPGSSTTISAANVAPGTYYVRVRAVNAQGVGIASSDTTLIVP